MSPMNHHNPFTTRICFDCTNNIVEYEACILGIEVTIDLRIKFFEVYKDLALVIHQIKGELETLHLNLIQYQDHVLKMIPYFDKITLKHTPMEENQLVDALSTLSSMYKVKWANEEPILRIKWLDELAYYLSVEKEFDGKLWFYDIKW